MKTLKNIHEWTRSREEQKDYDEENALRKKGMTWQEIRRRKKTNPAKPGSRPVSEETIDENIFSSDWKAKLQKCYTEIWKTMRYPAEMKGKPKADDILKKEFPFLK